MSYNPKPASQNNHGVVKIGANIEVVAGVISIPQSVAITAAPTFASLTSTGPITDSGNRVITSVTPASGTGIAITGVTTTGPASAFTVSNTGVITLTAGTGITLSGATGNVTVSATGGGSGEAGTWTPSIVSSAGATIALQIRNANYVRTGQGVFCTFDIEIDSIAGGDDDAALSLHGLPYVSATDVGYVGSVFVSWYSNLRRSAIAVSGSVNSNSTIATLWYNRNGSLSTLPSLTQDDVKATTRLVGVVQYVSAT